MRWIKLALFLVGISYSVHLFVVRSLPMSINPEGYLAMITPACWYWNLLSLIALVAFAYLYSIRQLKALEKELEVLQNDTI